MLRIWGHSSGQSQNFDIDFDPNTLKDKTAFQYWCSPLNIDDSGRLEFPNLSIHTRRLRMLILIASYRHLFTRQVFATTRCGYTSAAEKDELQLSYPDHSQLNHHDLSSFLGYASRVGLDPKSTTYVGTHYEYTALGSLSHLGMSLKQVGGSSDFGIDLLGTWDLPSVPVHLKVIAQCKALARAADPKMIRELEGAFAGAPVGWRGGGVLGLLVTQKEATKGVRDAVGRSRWPMGFVMCNGQGKILQMLWNRRAEEEGLLGVGVSLKYSGGHGEDREILLTWKGKSLEVNLSKTSI